MPAADHYNQEQENGTTERYQPDCQPQLPSGRTLGVEPSRTFATQINTLIIPAEEPIVEVEWVATYRGYRPGSDVPTFDLGIRHSLTTSVTLPVDEGSRRMDHR